MKNLNFKQPRYIIPLIMLPFLFLFYFIFSNWKGSSPQQMVIGDSLSDGRINPLMPGVARQITDEPVKDKFGAYQEAYKNNTDFSMIGNIDAEQRSGSDRLSSAYSATDIQQLQAQKTLDSLERVLQSGQSVMDRRMRSAGSAATAVRGGSSGRQPEYGRSIEESFLAEIERVNGGSGGAVPVPSRQSAAPRDSYAEQMDLFREQMKLVDSIQRDSQRKAQQGSGSGKAGIGDRQPDAGKRFDPSTDSTFKPMAVSLQPQWASDVHRKGFHTLRTQSPAPLVSAMIDQELKVHAGNRIRIRLLQDIYVGGTRVPKGTYLYAQVTGFQTSRINLSVTSVFLHGRTLPVELDIYDNDGYLGLYVPGSSFREFTKDIGTQATRGLSQLQTADQADIAASLLSQLFETATSATTKMIKKEKAVLTYNYSIYLKEKQ